MAQSQITFEDIKKNIQQGACGVWYCAKRLLSYE